MALDSVDDSDESDAADMGRLGERISSVLLSFDNVCNPETTELQTTAFALVATWEMEAVVLAVVITWGVDEFDAAEIANLK